MSESGRFQQCFLRRANAPLFGALCLLAYSASGYAVAFDAELAYTYDDNVVRSPREDDKLDDRFVAVTAGASFLKHLDTNHRFVLRGFLRGEKYDKYDGLSNNSAGGQVTYQYRGSGNLTAPTYAVFFRGVIAEYESDLRDSDLMTLGLSMRKSVTDRITFFTSLSGTLRDSDSTAFDTKEISLLANIDYALASNWTLYATANYLDGDVVSTVDANVYPTLPIVNAAEVINVDDGFAETGDTRTAYRLQARTIVATLGINYRLSERHSLDLSHRYADSRADDGINYQRWLHSLAYLFRF